jgi:hypothetical protein
MKRTIAIFLVLALVGPIVIRAESENDLKGKVVRLSGAVNGMGVVLLYRAGSYIILEDVDGSKRRKFDLQRRDYQLDVLADSREAYSRMLRDGLTFNSVAVVSDFTRLSESAERARKGRIGAGSGTLITGVVASLCGVYALLIGKGHSFMEISLEKVGIPTLACGLILSGVGTLVLSSKSSAERDYDRYLKEKARMERGGKLTLNIGLVRRGLVLGVGYCF